MNAGNRPWASSTYVQKAVTISMVSSVGSVRPARADSGRENAEPAGGDPPVEPAAGAACVLVHDREAVALVEVDEEQRQVLDGRVGDRDEERRPRLVDVPGVEVEEARLAPRQVRATPLERGRGR